MSSAHFRRALAATARVACLASVGACSATTKAPPAPAAQATVEPTAEHAAPVAVEEPAVAESCASVFAEMKPVGFGETGSDVQQSCCVQAMDKVGKDSFETPPELEAIGARTCCNIIGDMGERYAACTPWGPPAPPQMVSMSLIMV